MFPITSGSIALGSSHTAPSTQEATASDDRALSRAARKRNGVSRDGRRMLRTVWRPRVRVDRISRRVAWTP
ncbi:hypothetical protein GCM10017566_32460 [Amycolatopsis bartoniae]|uniref:Uncharacterized protein n=1 Tax=Amycolatopsis bartoniae TaxID=941986 RepID=A0A8H9MCQ8_9PSEU|nr:hypothetical protein GCM10017566_32460 [Amycolatopsis bartoniae]